VEVLQVSKSNVIEQKKARPCRYSKQEDPELLEMIEEILKERPSYGYRRITALLNSKRKELRQPQVNHKRVYRIMKLHQLLLRKRDKRPEREHRGKVETLLSNTRWCSDGFTIQCWNGDRVHVAFSIDSCDREVMRYIASTIGINGEAIRDLMLETVEYRFSSAQAERPVQWLSDNGSCYTAKETVSFGRQLGLDIRTTPTYSPESNGMAEAFVKTFKRDYVWFGDLKDAQTVMAQLPQWMDDYNEKAPHKALKMLSPREFLKVRKLAG
jgi:putative transposase